MTTNSRNIAPLTPLAPQDFEVQIDATHTYPFFEDENANGVYGHGHTDPAAFATGVNAYDKYLAGELYGEVGYTGEDVRHEYASGRHDGDGAFIDDFKAAPFEGATPITWVSR